MANGPFAKLFGASNEEQRGADFYSMLGTDVPALGEATSQGETAGFQPIGFGEGGTTMIDTSAPATQADLMQAGLTGDDAVLPLVGTGLVGAAGAKFADEALKKQQTKLFNQLYRGAGGRFTQGAKPVTRLDVLKNLGSRLGAMRGTSGMAGIANPYTAAATGLLALEEAPRLIGDKSTSEILTELAATTPEERAGAAEYAALGTDVEPLGGEPVIDLGVVSKPPAQTLSQFMRYEDRPEQRTEQFVDPQGRIRRRVVGTQELAPEYREYEREAAAREARLEDKPDFMEAIPTSMIDQRGEVETPKAADIPSEIQGILFKPAQMRTQDEVDRLARFSRSTLGKSLGGIAAIEESMMGPIQRQRAELGLQADQLRFEQERLRLEGAGFVPTDVETDPETGITVQIFKKGDETRRVFKGVARAPQASVEDITAEFTDSEGAKGDTKEGFSIVK